MRILDQNLIKKINHASRIDYEPLFNMNKTALRLNFLNICFHKNLFFKLLSDLRTFENPLLRMTVNNNSAFRCLNYIPYIKVKLHYAS